MRVVKGRLAEPKVYLLHCLGVLLPGTELPAFADPPAVNCDLSTFQEPDLKLVVDEGRRQLDRQISSLAQVQSRAATLTTVTLAEVALLAGGARRVFDAGVLTTVLWTVSGVCVLLAIGGLAALLTGPSVLGRTDTAGVAMLVPPLLVQVAAQYASLVGVGEETVRTRLTVLRDAVLLAVLGAVIYGASWPLAN